MALIASDGVLTAFDPLPTFTVGLTEDFLPASGAAYAVKTPVSGPGYPAIIVCHVRSSNSTHITTLGIINTFTDRLASVGFPVGCVSVGNTWGNDASRALMDELWETMIADHDADSDSVILHGDSMGTFTSYGWGADKPVLCYSSVGGLVDGDTAYAQFGSDFDTAYGSEAAWLAAKPTHDPMELAIANVFDGVPVKLWGGTLDTNAPVADMDAFAIEVGSSASVVEFNTNHIGMFVLTPPASIAGFIIGQYPPTRQQRVFVTI
jgi:hypothetical protein